MQQRPSKLPVIRLRQHERANTHIAGLLALGVLWSGCSCGLAYGKFKKRMFKMFQCSAGALREAWVSSRYCFAVRDQGLVGEFAAGLEVLVEIPLLG